MAQNRTAMVFLYFQFVDELLQKVEKCLELFDFGQEMADRQMLIFDVLSFQLKHLLTKRIQCQIDTIR